MNQTTPNDTLSPEDGAQSREQTSSEQSNSRQRKWIHVPEELPQWLTKRIEFSVPIWALIIAAVILTVLVFD